VSLNPFDLPDGTSEPDDTKKGFLLALLRAMVPAGSGAEAAVEDALLTAAIQQTYARALSERREEGVLRKTFTGARLSDLVRVLVTLEEVGERPASAAEKERARSLALRLQPWTGDTPFGNLLDRESTVLPDAQVLYFETSGLDAYPQLQNVATLLIAEAVWTRVRANPRRRKLVILDEFWTLLRIPQAAAFIVEIYRRFRRYNAAAYAVTQSLRDFTGEAAQGILQNTSYHLLLPVPGESAVIQDLLRLPDRAIEAFHSLSEGSHYRELLAWVRKDGIRQGDVLRIVPTPLEYWAFTTNADEIAERERTLERHAGRVLPAIEELASRYPYGLGQHTPLTVGKVRTHAMVMDLPKGAVECVGFSSR
jgi:conjugal transfer ATP-binding protein TraC